MRVQGKDGVWVDLPTFDSQSAQEISPQKRGGDVQIRVIEVLDGMQAQIVAELEGEPYIVYESSIFDTDSFDTGRLGAGDAAVDEAHQKFVTVLRKLFR